jgi:hypothetical protein
VRARVCLRRREGLKNVGGDVDSRSDQWVVGLLHGLLEVASGSGRVPGQSLTVK